MCVGFFLLEKRKPTMTEQEEPEELPAAPQPETEQAVEPVAVDAPAEPPPQPSDEGWQTVKPKRRGRPPGSRNKPKIVAIAPEVIEEEAPEPDVHPHTQGAVAPAPVRAAVRATRRQAPEERRPVYFAPPGVRPRAAATHGVAATFGHRDLGSILSEHLLQVETQKRLSQQEMYARLVRGVL